MAYVACKSPACILAGIRCSFVLQLTRQRFTHPEGFQVPLQQFPPSATATDGFIAVVNKSGQEVVYDDEDDDDENHFSDTDLYLRLYWSGSVSSLLELPRPGQIALVRPSSQLVSRADAYLSFPFAGKILLSQLQGNRARPMIVPVLLRWLWASTACTWCPAIQTCRLRLRSASNCLACVWLLAAPTSSSAYLGHRRRCSLWSYSRSLG